MPKGKEAGAMGSRKGSGNGADRSNKMSGFTPEADNWYPLEFGDSFDGDSSTEFYTIRYEFKPASIDVTKPGTLRKRSDKNEVVAEFPNNQNGKDKVVFNGHVEPYKEDQDAVLIFDGKTFRLERLHHAVKLRHVRKADVENEKNSETEVPTSGDRKPTAEFSPGSLMKNVQEEKIQINDPFDAPDFLGDNDKNGSGGTSLKHAQTPPAEKRVSKGEPITRDSSLPAPAKKVENRLQGSPKYSGGSEHDVDDHAERGDEEEDGDDVELDVEMEIEEALNKSKIEEEEEEIDICDEDNDMDEFVECAQGDDNGQKANAKEEDEEAGDGNANDAHIAAGLKSSSESESGSETGSESESVNGSDDGDDSQSSGDD